MDNGKNKGIGIKVRIRISVRGEIAVVQGNTLNPIPYHNRVKSTMTGTAEMCKKCPPMIAINGGDSLPAPRGDIGSHGHSALYTYPGRVLPSPQQLLH